MSTADENKMGKDRTLPFSAHRIVLICWCCLLVLAGCGDPSNQTTERQMIHEDDESPGDSSIVHLYFSDRENSFLIAENRHILNQDDPIALGTQIMHALLMGPQKALARTIPEKTKLKAFYLVPDNIAFVDLSVEIMDDHPGGAKSELLTIYSIVNSLILNIPEIEAVKLLIDGRETSTLAGHIDLRSPFKANMMLIR
jgi:spore germination protein GerM